MQVEVRPFYEDKVHGHNIAHVSISNPPVFIALWLGRQIEKEGYEGAESHMRKLAIKELGSRGDNDIKYRGDAQVIGGCLILDVYYYEGSIDWIEKYMKDILAQWRADKVSCK